ncbi:MAG: glutamate racemase, partial [Desulfotomaculaceae bacterium]
YFGDTARVPYGSKTPDQLKGFAKEILEFLITRRVKFVILACNTSSSISLDYVRKLFTIPMIGVVQPGADEAVRVTLNRKIGVIATGATVKSRAYESAIERASKKCNKRIRQVYSMATPELVPLVESGQWDGEKTIGILKEYLQPFEEEGIDTLVLGCTHYPFLLEAIQSIIKPGIKIVDPAKLTVQQTCKEMLRLGILNNSGAVPVHEYWVSGDTQTFKSGAEKFLGIGLPSVNWVDLK